LENEFEKTWLEKEGLRIIDRGRKFQVADYKNYLVEI